MTTHTSTSSRTSFGSVLHADPARQAFLLLRTVFTVAPIVFGLDKFANVLVDWPRYLATPINNLVPGSGAYDEQLAELAGHGLSDTRELFFALALDDVSAAAACLRPIHDRTHGRDGFVSFECTPDIADDTTATVEQASDLWSRLGLPNVMIKVPGT